MVTEFARWQNVVLLTTYHSSSSDAGELRSCREAWSGRSASNPATLATPGNTQGNINTDGTFDKYRKPVCRQAGFDPSNTLQLQKCKTALGSAAKLFGPESANDVLLLRTMVMAKAVSNALDSFDFSQTQRTLVDPGDRRRIRHRAGHGPVDSEGACLPDRGGSWVRAYFDAVRGDHGDQGGLGSAFGSFRVAHDVMRERPDARYVQNFNLNPDGQWVANSMKSGIDLSSGNFSQFRDGTSREVRDDVIYSNRMDYDVSEDTRGGNRFCWRTAMPRFSWSARSVWMALWISPRWRRLARLRRGAERPRIHA